MNRLTSHRKGVLIGLLIGLLFSALFAGKFSAHGVPLIAQPRIGTTREKEADDTDDAYEGLDIPITGTNLEKAGAAALDYLGEGRVTDTEVDDEDANYEVEITRGNGRQVDIHLDKTFNVLGQEND